MYVRRKDIKPFDKKVWLASPTMHGDELKYITEAYDSNWMSTVGANINEVEHIAAQKAEMKYAVALSSCTAALHLCVRAAGERLYGRPAIGHGAVEGRRVFCSDMTFAATLNPVVYEGGIPVFIDTERDTWNMNPRALERAFEIYPEVQLVVAAHLYGFPGKADEIRAVCDAHGALLIEDAAESMGATYKGRQTGSFGDYAAISYNGNKIITTGAGGAVVSNHADWAEHAKHLSTQAKADMLQFLHDEVGYNYRMTNVQASLGIAQLERLEGFIAHKKALYDRYVAALDGVKGLRILPFREEACRSNHWFFSLYVKDAGLDRDTVIEKLQAQQIQTRPVWALIHEQADYPRNEAYGLDKALDYRKYIVNLPCSTNLSMEDCDRVIEAVLGLLK